MDKPVSEMVERVARAMARWNYPGGSDRDIDEMWDGWAGEAIAAIKAMREPTKLMLKAPGRYLSSDEMVSVGMAAFAWPEMIDAALGDTNAA